MSLLSVVQQVCSVVGVLRPQAVIPTINSNRTMQEMLDLANEMAQRIAYDTRDWTQLRVTKQFVGDGVMVPPPPDPNGVLTGTTAFPMPANYKRMLVDSNVWRSTSTLQPMRFIASSDEWLQRRAANWTDAWGEWMLQGGNMHIYPIMPALIPAVPPNTPAVPAVTATFMYLETGCIKQSQSPFGFASEFVNDADTFRLDERLLKLGMIWQWKANKGSPYAEDMGTYSDAIANDMGHDQPAPTYIGRSPISANARIAYPFATPSGPVMPVGP